MDVVSLGTPPPAPADGSPLSAIMGVASKAMPQVQLALGAIKGIKDVWDAVKPQSSTVSLGPTTTLPYAITKENQERLNQVVWYAVADKFVKELMRIGKDAGIDFTTWKNGEPPPAAPAAPAPADKGAGKPTAPAHGAAPPAKGAPPPAHAPAPAAPAAPPAPTPPDPKTVKLLAELQNLTIDYLKSRAIEDLQHKIATAGKKNLNPTMWYWNGANQHGTGPAPRGNKTEDTVGNVLGVPTYDRDHDRRTWAEITWHLGVDAVPSGTPMGLPEELKYFSAIQPDVHHASSLAWFTGGRCVIVPEEAHGDKLTVTPHISGTIDASVNNPVGAHHMGFEFLWDNSETSMDCGVTFSPANDFAYITDVVLSSTVPET
jgi:hypothetical protein